MKNKIFILAAALFFAGHVQAQGSWEFKILGTKFSNPAAPDLEAVHFIDENNGLVAGLRGLIAKTSDGGATWDSIPFGGKKDLYEFNFINRNVGFLCGFGIVLKTKDGGSTWSNISGDIDTNLLYTDVYFADENNGFVTGHQVYRTSNGGKNWTKLTSSNLFKHSVSFTNISNGYLCANSGILAKRINNSKGTDSFKVLTGVPIGNDMYSIHAYNDSSAIAVGASGAILLTTNYGASWSSRTTAGTHAYNKVHGPDQNNFWAVGTSGKIAYSSDGGSSWTSQNSGSSFISFRDVYMLNTTIGWAVGGGNLLMKYSNCSTIDANVSDLGGTLKVNTPGLKYQWVDCNTEEGIPNASSQYFTPAVSGSYLVQTSYAGCNFNSKCIQVWVAGVKPNHVPNFSLVPNPAQDVVKIDNILAGSHISIANIAGSEVLNFTAGNGEISIPVATLQNGLYIVKVQGNGYSQTQRLVVNR
jgi:photosystem II stability/assembly factor-like uncharacterized protein